MLHTLTALAACATLAAFAAPAQAADYVIEPTHTFASFEITHFGAAKNRARFDKKEGTVQFDRAAKTGKVELTIDAASISSGVPQFDRHLKSADNFDVEKFPTIKFVGDKFTFDGDKVVSVSGDLTIKGVTKPVTLALTSFILQPHPMLKKDAIGADASVVVKRSEFNAGKYAPHVGDDVTISIAIEAIKG